MSTGVAEGSSVKHKATDGRGRGRAAPELVDGVTRSGSGRGITDPRTILWKAVRRQYSMDWRIKGVIQKVLGYIPAGQLLHHALQRRVGGLADFGRECDIKVDDWRLMMGHLQRSGARVRGGTLLEMGTGWYPTFPLCRFLAGAVRVYTLDLNRLLRPEMTVALADRLANHVAPIASVSGRTETEVAARQKAVAAALHGGASIGA